MSRRQCVRSAGAGMMGYQGRDAGLRVMCGVGMVRVMRCDDSARDDKIYYAGVRQVPMT